MAQHLTLPAGGDESRGPVLMGAQLFSFALATCVVVARVCYRHLKSRSTGWDDLLIVVALMAAAVNTALMIKYVVVGGGRHSFYLGLQAANVAKWSTIAQIPSVFSLMFTKVSIAVMLMRISPSRRLRWVMWSLVVVVVSVSVIEVITMTAGCRPFEANWNYALGRRGCWPKSVLQGMNYLLSVTNIVSDFIYITFPIYVIWNLKITNRQKFAISGIVALGLL
ncbi:hypothetical protein BU23DRAFT_450048 [Bimuria novae-zelandiae CBS 107.79]|uniref:Rhodopsin domain-containing protein n=1 Tax=Bimuria novae-zelandiae CBS 107.79 TaxID=1447943 RepID=A0A6A5VN04_9PLEO|nr:hypothetical protein BU23DRAFT_450048 [Bimuria novae-zelandiae CBS 107.79]